MLSSSCIGYKSIYLPRSEEWKGWINVAVFLEEFSLCEKIKELVCNMFSFGSHVFVALMCAVQC